MSAIGGTPAQVITQPDDEEVCPAPVTVPALSPSGMGVLVLTLLIVGWYAPANLRPRR